MRNELWRVNSDQLAAYCENPDVWKRIKRYYPSFTIMAMYERDGEVFAIQYLVPNVKKRSARRLLGVNVSELVRKTAILG